jgi:hypothetical protein
MGFSLSDFLSFLLSNPGKISSIANKLNAILHAVDEFLGEFGAALPRSVPSVADQSACEEIAALLEPHIPQERKLGDGKFLEAFTRFANSAFGQLLLQLAMQQLGKLGS